MSADLRSTMAAPAATYQQRRAQLAQQLSRPLVICAGHAPAINYPANVYPFRAGATYRYFGGAPVEHAAMVVLPGSDGAKDCWLLRPPADPDDVIWMGAGPRDAQLAELAGIPAGAVRDVGDLADVLQGNAGAVIHPPQINTARWVRENNLQPATEDEVLAVINLRLNKDEHELVAMRRAAEIGMEAQRAALAATKPGAGEADVAAAVHAVLVKHQAQYPYPHIVTVHGEILHPHGQPHPLRDGNLMLVDVGAEEQAGYASDMTRTFPVNGAWSDVQRILYESAERALNEAVAACVPGRNFEEIHDLAAGIICEGLVQAELLRGDPAELLRRKAHTLFFVHGLGHLIGIDVHDMEDFGDLAGYGPGRKRRTHFGDYALRCGRDMAPGMCMTVEPGIYLVPAVWERADLVEPFEDCVNRSAVDALLKCEFGGIRVEHTICVRAQGGPEILTAALPTDADELLPLIGANA